MANNTEWNISTDIYTIVDSINNVKKRYIEDEDETTLALGVFGFITDTEAKKIQTSTIMTGQLGNEMFATRAKLTKNVLSHAIYNNILDINAVPARMTINMGIKLDDFNKYVSNDTFILDCKCPIFIGDYEFHFDYDIVFNRSMVGTNEYMYSAHYDMSVENRLSNITDPYLKQPFIVPIGNYKYLIFQALIRQVTIEETTDKIITDSIVENKTYTFEFDNQIADFDVYVTDNGVETRLTPVLHGSSSEDLKNYCWYLFISDNTIRITFDSKSYIPGLNSNIYIKAYTTLGSGGIFNYKKIDDSSDGIYVDMNSTKYNYSKITCYMVAVTDSENGSDRKSKADLQKLIPKAALSRGSITTETDVNNYFNMIDSEENRLVMRKKVDNNISRVWYGYFLLKDDNENIIPTNTLPLEISTANNFMVECEDGRFILPAGTIIKYNPEYGYGIPIDETYVPELFSEEYFDGQNYYYMTVYNIILDLDPLYAAFYLSAYNKDKFFTFDWVNESSVLQFVASRIHLQRNLLTDQSTYKINFNIAQSIASDYDLYIKEEVEGIDENGNRVTDIIVTNNIKVIMVINNSDGYPYRWVEGTITNADMSNYTYSFEINLETDNGLDNSNRIKIENVNAIGTTNMIYGYFDPNTSTSLYILAKFPEGEYGRYDLDDIVPGLEGYSVTNVYNVESGIDFYENFTNVLDTRVNVLGEVSENKFSISGVPLVGLHYMTDEDKSNYLIDAISEKKAYIEYCLTLLENNMDVDFKFFNTYGRSRTYSIGDKLDTMIGDIDLTMKFRVSLKTNSDVYIKDDLVKIIKSYIEDLYETEDWHAPNMISEITSKYSTRINYLEFINYNDFWLGVQHITKLDIDDNHIVPEFINIRNKYSIDGQLIPCIEIEIV